MRIATFPLAPMAKTPAIKGWPEAASTDPEQHRRWESEIIGAGLGAVTGSGRFVLDTDPKNGGPSTLAALEAEHGSLPETWHQVTPSGGDHRWFSTPAGLVVRNSAGKLGDGLDTRGEGGFVVVAPTRTHAGRYAWKPGRAPWEIEIAAAPEWLLERLRPRPALHLVKNEPTPTFPPASPETLAAARAAVIDEHGPAVEGNGGDQHTFVAAALLCNDFALTEEEAWPLLVEWNAECQPPWSVDELAAKMRGGSLYATRPFGCRRSTDALTLAKTAINEWRESGTGDAGIEALAQRLRSIVADYKVDPTVRALIETEMIGASGIKSRALALPRAFVRATAGGDVEVSNWAGLDLSPTGAPIVNLNNVVIILEREGRAIGFDTFLQKTVHPNAQGEWVEWTDADDLALTLDLQRRLGLTKMLPQVVSQAVNAFAHRNERNSVRDTLERLTWDGTPRIETFFIRAFGTEDSPYTRAASTNWWRGLVARPLWPGCKVDTMIVLEGLQGLNKSTALRVIAGRYFAEASESPHSKDFFLALVGKLIVEIAEMDAFSRAEVTAVKRVLSCAVDRFRAPYERATRDWPRQGIFAGTTNRSDWHRDDTGGRRFWPIACTAIDLDLIRRERTQLFAEAVASVKADAPWWEMPPEATAAAQEARRQSDPWEDVLTEHLMNVSRTTINELLAHPLGLFVSAMGKPEQMRVASILRRLGFARVDGRLDGQKAKFWQRREQGGNDATA